MSGRFAKYAQAQNSEDSMKHFLSVAGTEHFNIHIILTKTVGNLCRIMPILASKIQMQKNLDKIGIRHLNFQRCVNYVNSLREKGLACNN